jgi:hypothetical protein
VNGARRKTWFFSFFHEYFFRQLELVGSAQRTSGAKQFAEKRISRLLGAPQRLKPALILRHVRHR